MKTRAFVIAVLLAFTVDAGEETSAMVWTSTAPSGSCAGDRVVFTNAIAGPYCCVSSTWTPCLPTCDATTEKLRWDGSAWTCEQDQTAASGGGDAPVDATYVVGSANAALTAERVATDTATVDVDTGTAGQMKWNVLSAPELSADPSACASDLFVTDIDADGTLTCTAITGGMVTTAVATATALAANGANCSAGSAPLGVDASGAAESCTDYVDVAGDTMTGNLTVPKLLFTSGPSLDDLSSSVIGTGDGENFYVSNQLRACTSTSTGGGACFQLNPGTGDHTYMALHARTASPSTTSGRVGYTSAATNELSVANLISGGHTVLRSTGTGGVMAVTDATDGFFQVQTAGSTRMTIYNHGGAEFNGDITANRGITVGVNTGAGVLSLKPGSANDHTFIQFFARTASPSTRSGYIGYPSAGSNTLTFQNSLGGMFFDLASGQTATFDSLVAATQFQSTVSTGTAPLVVASTTEVSNLRSATATALAANGANCSSGEAPLGVNASGAVESCFDVATQVELDAAIANPDADTFDGMDSARFVFGDNGTATTDGTATGADNLTKSGFYRQNDISSLILHTHHPTDTGYAFQMHSSYGGPTTGFYLRRKHAGAWSSSEQIVTFANDGPTSGLAAQTAATATALAANGANCSSGSAPLGVDASGAAEACFDVATQTELDAVTDDPIITFSAASGLSGERVLSDGDYTTVDISTAGQVKVQVAEATAISHGVLRVANDLGGSALSPNVTGIRGFQTETGGPVEGEWLTYLPSVSGTNPIRWTNQRVHLAADFSPAGGAASIEETGLEVPVTENFRYTMECYLHTSAELDTTGIWIGLDQTGTGSFAHARWQVTYHTGVAFTAQDILNTDSLPDTATPSTSQGTEVRMYRLSASFVPTGSVGEVAVMMATEDGNTVTMHEGSYCNWKAGAE